MLCLMAITLAFGFKSSTGSGFTFSDPIFYDGMTYVGNDTFVRCAEGQKRYGKCSTLSICVEVGTTYSAFLKRAFPSDYVKVGSSFEQIIDMLLDNECNVLASEVSFIQSVASLNEGFRNRNFTVGTKRLTKEPHAIITGNHDHAFSDAINWVVKALMFGEEQGLTKDPLRCQNSADSTTHRASDLRFLNAVFCVGNYRDIYVGDLAKRGMNNVNKGTGMLYATPFGNLDKYALISPRNGDHIASSMLRKIRNETSLRCGVTVPYGYEEDIADSDKLVGLSVEYCRALAAAIYIGDMHRVQFVPFHEADNSSVIALANGTIDVLVGEVQQKWDFEVPPSFRGLQFSTPYYYWSVGNNVSFCALATREDDTIFASFVNSIVLATIYALENDIQKKDSGKMPFASIFGTEMAWAFKDVIANSGNYDEMYVRSFGDRDSDVYKNRNTLSKGGPQMHSLLWDHSLSDDGLSPSLFL